MNEKIEMKKKLLKQALSKNQNKEKQPLSQTLVRKIQQKKSLQQKPIQVSKFVQNNPKKQLQNYVNKNHPIRIESEISSINQDDSIYAESQKNSEKPSYRSSFSESLYTQETDNVKTMISKVFGKKKFIQQLHSSIGQQKQLKNKQLINDQKERIISNQIFILSLQSRLRQKEERQKLQIIEKQVKKKVNRQILLNQNQKECYNAQKKLQNFLQEKLKKIKRKDY